VVTGKEDVARIEFKYRNILKELNDLIIECDSTYKIREVFGNVDLTGYTVRDLIGAPLSLLFQLHPNVGHVKKLALEGEVDSRIFSAKLRKKDGSFLEVALSSNRVMDGYGAEILFLTIRDIGYRLKLIKQNKEMSQRIRRAEKLAYVGSLTQGLTHNLQGPLSALLGRAQLMAMKYKDERELGEIINIARTMSDVIKTLLLKINNEQGFAEQILDINQILKSELTVLEADLRFKHNVKKHYSFEQNLPLIRGIYGDFSQSFANIFKNALEAMNDSNEKTLTVTTEFDEKHIIVTIGDTGRGIVKEYLSKIFEPYFTTKAMMSNGIDDESSGTGLGLASVQELMSPYQAAFDVQSTVGEGTSFRILIPYKKTDLPVEDEIKARVEVRLQQVIRSIHVLPTIPNVLYEVLNSSASEISINRLAQMVQNDYALAGKIFTIVNSAYYSLMKPISSLIQAISYIGLAEVRNICYSLLSLQIMTSSTVKPYVHELWNHSLCASVISREIMKHLGKEIEMGYLTSLLHDIGKIVLLDNYALVTLNKTLPFSGHLLSRREELERFSLTHDTVGSWFLREKTRFPKAMREAIERHHQIPSPKEPELTRLIFFSNRLAYEVNGTSKPSYDSLELGSLLWNLSSTEVNAILEKSKEAIQQVKKTYKIDQ